MFCFVLFFCKQNYIYRSMLIIELKYWLIWFSEEDKLFPPANSFMLSLANWKHSCWSFTFNEQIGVVSNLSSQLSTRTQKIVFWLIGSILTSVQELMHPGVAGKRISSLSITNFWKMAYGSCVSLEMYQLHVKDE